MGGGGKGSESSTTQGFDQSVWEPQAQALGGVYGNANQLFNQTYGDMQGQQAGAVDYMNRVRDESMPFWQDQMAGGAYQGMDLQGQYNRAMRGGGNEQFMNEQIMGGAGNNYADAMRGQVMSNAQGLQDQMLQGTDARAAAAGMSGGSRHGIAQAQGMADINQQATDSLSQIGYDTFSQDQQRKMDIARNADQFDMQRLQSAGGMLGQQQNTMNQGLAGASGMQNLGMGAFAPSMAPWQAMGQYGNVVGRPTVLGSANMEQSSSGGGKSPLGTIARIGAGVMTGGASEAGMAAAGAAGAMG